MFLTKQDILKECEFRSIFVSDIHLGSKFSQSESLLEFLKVTSSQNLFLVGDIIDGWAIKRKMNWSQFSSDVIQKILRKARKGTNVYYIVGNHDDFLRKFLPLYLGNSVQILDDFSYTSLQNKRFLVTHGDFFDSVTMTKRWLAVLGDKGYDALLNINSALNFTRRKLHIKSSWSLSNFVKQNVKSSVNFITDFESVLSSYARKNGFDGVICGHIHKAEFRHIDDIIYLNCGDWVESCTGIVETKNGEFKLVKWQ